MAEIYPNVIRQILLEGRAGTRFLNETAVQLDVWTEFGLHGEGSVDLLLTPYDSTPAPKLAKILHEALRERERRFPRRIAPLEAAVAIRLDIHDFILQVLPRTGLDLVARTNELMTLIRSKIADSRNGLPSDPTLSGLDLFHFAQEMHGTLSPDLRATVLGLLLLIAHETPKESIDRLFALNREFDQQRELEWLRSIPLAPAKLLQGVAQTQKLIWKVARNRPVHTLAVSVETIKADAALRVFEVDCRPITWAVIDSGIDGSHPAFRDHDGDEFATRVVKAYDFSSIRTLASYDLHTDNSLQWEANEILSRSLHPRPQGAMPIFQRLQADAQAGRPYDWEALSELIEVAPDALDSGNFDRPSAHGTHVAGILAGDWRENGETVFRGVCPNIRLYDLRVLGNTSEDTEFAVMAALEFVRWLNGRNRYMTIHGVNLSVGLTHDRENYACGRTPVCLACEATVAAGVTVVSAAGNWGSQTFATTNGSYFGYASISIADPGNAASVITVGATHRERPHEYGVSFFSSRGPTADGRLKPDVVAPGEKIDGPLPNLGFGRLDGTSMAAPHVSGVAALLMARHPELIGDPARVKSVIVSTATDLGRERHFQGAGLVDALRALQAL